MGGARIGYISYTEIHSFLSLGLSKASEPVDSYVRIIITIDNEYVYWKQREIDSKMDKEMKGSKGGSNPSSLRKTPSRAPRGKR